MQSIKITTNGGTRSRAITIHRICEYKALLTPPTRSTVRVFPAIQKHVFVFCLAFMLVLFNAQGFMAFEAHVVNVKATIARVDPPEISPASGTEYTGPVEVMLSGADTDATHVFYAITAGTDEVAAPAPVCGDTAGGSQPLTSFPLIEDAVVKAIACDGADTSAHGSVVVSAVYDFLLGENASIHGHIYHDIDQTGIFEDNVDIPLEGWRVVLLDSKDRIASTTITNAGGYYKYRGVPKGAYTIQEESRSGWTHITPKDFPVGIESGTESLTFDFYNVDTEVAPMSEEVAVLAQELEETTEEMAATTTVSDVDDTDQSDSEANSDRAEEAGPDAESTEEESIPVKPEEGDTASLPDPNDLDTDEDEVLPKDETDAVIPKADTTSASGDDDPDDDTEDGEDIIAHEIQIINETPAEVDIEITTFPQV